MKAFALNTAAFAVRALAAIASLFAGRRRDGLLLISCQGDEPSQDILDLAEALRSLPDAQRVAVIASRMRRSIGGAFSFIGKLFSMLRHIAGARVVVIDAYCMAVSIPKKRPGQKVVQLWHAPEAIKKFSLQIVDTPAGYDSRTAKILCMHRNYDYILCPADATKPFFAEAFGYPEDVFVKHGLPSLDRIGRMRKPEPYADASSEPGTDETPERLAAREAIYNKYPVLAGSPVIARRREGDEAIHPKEGKRPLTIVYAPTFRDGIVVDAAGIVGAFANIENTALVLKLHPLDAEGPSPEPSPEPSLFLASPDPDLMATAAAGEHKKNRPRYVVDNVFPLLDWYAVADVIITDYSGVAIEAAAAGIASYYYIYDIEDYKTRRGLNVDLCDEAIGKYAFTDAGELTEQLLNDFSDKCVYDYEALASFAKKYLEVPLSGNTNKLADLIVNIHVQRF